MRSYELTDRGKIIIAVVLIIVLLVIPSIIILVASSCSGESPPDGSPPSSQQTQSPEDDVPPVISDSPLPTPGSGFDPSAPDSTETPASPSPTPAPDSPQNDALPTPVATPTPTAPPEDGVGNSSSGTLSEYGPVGLNLSEGTMLFIFSPDVQETLDEETINMLGEFLSSPKNTSTSMIKVDMPGVSAGDEAAIISAVSGAFSEYNVTENGLVYEKTSESAGGRYFEISLSYTPIPARSK